MEAVSVIELTEQQIMDQIADRLAGIFPRIPVDAVARLVHEQHARFEGRPIRDFVPLFVERQARDRLGELEASAAHA